MLEQQCSNYINSITINHENCCLDKLKTRNFEFWTTGPARFFLALLWKVMIVSDNSRRGRTRLRSGSRWPPWRSSSSAGSTSSGRGGRSSSYTGSLAGRHGLKIFCKNIWTKKIFEHIWIHKIHKIHKYIKYIKNIWMCKKLLDLYIHSVNNLF